MYATFLSAQLFRIIVHTRYTESMVFNQSVRYLHQREAFIVISFFTALYLLFGLLFLAFTAPYRAPDEGPHYTYANTLYTQHRIPAIWESLEGHQPPLYYLLLQPFFWMTPDGTKFSRVYLLRIATLLIGAGLPTLVYLTSRRLFPIDRFVQIGATAVATMTPQFLFMNGVINNDALTNLAGAASLFLIVRTLQEGELSRRAMIWNMVVVFAGVFSKLSLAPLALLLFALTLWKGLRHWRWISLTLIPILAGVVVLALHNIHVYHDATAFSYMKKAWYADQHRFFFSLSGLADWFRALLESYWARFGHANIVLPRIYYTLITFIAVVGAAGLALFGIRDFKKQNMATRRSLAATALVALILFVGTFVYSLTFYQPQGRYLFPAIGAFSIVFTLGIRTVVPLRLRIPALALLLAFLLLLDIKSAILIWSTVG